MKRKREEEIMTNALRVNILDNVISKLSYEFQKELSGFANSLKLKSTDDEDYYDDEFETYNEDYYDDLIDEREIEIENNQEKYNINNNSGLGIVETYTSYILRFFVPGCKLHDIDIEIEDETIINVRGNISSSYTIPPIGTVNYNNDYPYAYVFRMDIVDRNIELKKITKELNDGILTINIPKII